jgi:glycosyltransferase involved in cell wall biosynthesis
MKLSIITINLNNSSGLIKTIKSVISQIFNDYEFIIIDGASADKSIDLIKQYSNKISFWLSEPDTGIYNAMNKGIVRANGEYCLFLNSGDWLFNETVLKDVFDNNFSEDIIYGNEIIELNGEYKNNTFIQPEFITFNSFLESNLPHQCTFIKRNLFNVVGLYNEKNKIVSDWEWNAIALFRYNCTLRKIHLPISFYDKIGISINSQYMTIQLAEKRASLQMNFPRIITDSDEYFKLLKRYNKIPRIISAFFNKIR